MKTIEITITPEGQTTVEARGFQGPSCRDATRDLLRALGVGGDEEVTAEFYASESQFEGLSEGARIA